MTLDLDNIYKVLLGRGPDAHGGGKIQDSAREYWNQQYTDAGGGEAGLASVISGVKGSQEFKDLGLGADFDHVANPNTASHRVQAGKSTQRGAGVRGGWIPSYDDMYDESGVQRPEWKGSDAWYEGKLKDTIAERDALADGSTIAGYKDQISGYQSQVSEYSKQLAELQKKYDQSQIDIQNVWNNANWGMGYNPYGQTYGGVGGVRGANELPGFIPRTRGTGAFSRGGMNALKTSALNLA